MKDINYLSDKMRSALVRTHSAWRDLDHFKQFIPAEYLVEHSPEHPHATFQPGHWSVRCGFAYMLICYCELYGMVDLVKDHRTETALVDRLLGFDHEQFAEWLNRFERSGGVEY